VATDFERPTSIGFHHTVLIRTVLLKTDVDARIRYTFEATQPGTSVLRELDLTFTLRGISRLALPYLLRAFRRENERTLACLKRYVEAQ